MASKAPRKKKSIDFSKPVGNVLNPYLMTLKHRIERLVWSRQIENL